MSKMNTKRSKNPSSVSPEQQSPIQLALNDLPHNVIDEILSLMPIEAAVGTSFISRFWRGRWRSIPDLIFCNSSEKFVTNALLHHSGKIRKFKFCGPLTPAVDCWLIALSSRAADSLHSLLLNFSHLDDLTDVSHLHSTAFAFPHLTTLVICNCRITHPPDFHGFKRLVIIELARLYFPDASQLSSLLSSSPCLENVSLVSVFGSGCLKIHGSNIRRLRYVGVSFDDFALGSCQRLEHADIDLCLVEGGESYGGEYFDVSQWLALGRHSLKILAMFRAPERNHINFDNLSSISLYADFSDFRSISATISLIKSCPNLKDLEIESFVILKYRTEDCEKIWGEQVNFDIFPKLQTVKFYNMMLEDSDLELVRLILETARVLQVIELYVDLSSEIDRESAFIKMLEFRRASNEARMLFNTQLQFLELS